MWYSKLLPSIALALLCAFTAAAQIPPAEQLLPDDTIGVITLPDWSKASASYNELGWGAFLEDPAMKPFMDKFKGKFKTEIITPLENQLGMKLSEYKDLLQGQVTLAFTPPREGTDQFFGVLFLLDAKNKSDQLSTRLAALKKKWSESGKETRTEKIRDTEFNVVSFTRAEVQAFLEKAFPGSPDEEEEEEETEEKDKAATDDKTMLYVGQYKSLLIAGENPKAIEKLLARQSGGIVPSLAEHSSFQKSQATLLRDSIGYGWVNIQPIYDKVLALLKKSSQEGGQPAMPQFDPAKILPALGLNTIQSLAMKLGGNTEGSVFEVFLASPEAQRAGLMKILTLEKKDAAPPPFVPADAVEFQRIRINAQKSWAGLEEMLNKIDPSFAGMLQIMLGAVESAGKQQNPDFSIRKNLIGNLGDDFITYKKSPKVAKASEMEAAPTLILIGSSDAPQLLEAMRVVSLLAPVEGPAKEREFLGKKIYSITTMTPNLSEEDEDAEPKTHTLSFTTSGGYVAFSTDNSILEEYLRSTDSGVKPLRDVQGLREASLKAGGMENGFFTYENQAESMRTLFETIRNDPEGFRKAMFFQFGRVPSDEKDEFKEWFDLSLLPPFEKVAKYFHIAVTSGATTAEGFNLKVFAPTPPGLRK